MHNVSSEQRRGMSLFFDHRDPDQVDRLGTARLDT
jgi:hypothetical protein